MRWLLILPLALATAGCATADFADGVTGFGKAVTSVDNSESALAKADQQAQLDDWYFRAAKAPRAAVTADLTQCRATPYHAGDCRVVVADDAGVGPAPLTPVESSLPALKAYSDELAAVVTDKSCATLKSDASSLATEVGSLAKLAGVAAPAATSPLATIASTLGCWEIAHVQLRILQAATEQADPIIQKLAPLIANKDANMAASVVRLKQSALNNALIDYHAGGATSLPRLFELATAVDTARTAAPADQIAKLAQLHKDLTTDLRDPKVTWKRIRADAKALAADAKTLETAYTSLAAGANSTPAKKPAA